MKDEIIFDRKEFNSVNDGISLAFFEDGTMIAFPAPGNGIDICNSFYYKGISYA